LIIFRFASFCLPKNKIIGIPNIRQRLLNWLGIVWL